MRNCRSYCDVAITLYPPKYFARKVVSFLVVSLEKAFKKLLKRQNISFFVVHEKALRHASEAVKFDLVRFRQEEGNSGKSETLDVWRKQLKFIEHLSKKKLN